LVGTIAARRRHAARGAAVAERCFATRKAALVVTQRWPTHTAARTASFAWIAADDNRLRHHAALADQTPAACEEAVVALRPAVP